MTKPLWYPGEGQKVAQSSREVEMEGAGNKTEPHCQGC